MPLKLTIEEGFPLDSPSWLIISTRLVNCSIIPWLVSATFSPSVLISYRDSEMHLSS